MSDTAHTATGDAADAARAQFQAEVLRLIRTITDRQDAMENDLTRLTQRLNALSGWDPSKEAG